MHNFFTKYGNFLEICKTFLKKIKPYTKNPHYEIISKPACEQSASLSKEYKRYREYREWASLPLRRLRDYKWLPHDSLSRSLVVWRSQSLVISVATRSQLSGVALAKSKVKKQQM